MWCKDMMLAMKVTPKKSLEMAIANNAVHLVVVLPLFLAVVIIALMGRPVPRWLLVIAAILLALGVGVCVTTIACEASQYRKMYGGHRGGSSSSSSKTGCCTSASGQTVPNITEAACYKMASESFINGITPPVTWKAGESNCS